MKFLSAILLLTLPAAAVAEDPPRLPAGQAATAFPVAAPQPAPKQGPDTWVAPLLAKAMPSVVSVFPAQILKEGELGAEDPLKRFFGQDKKSGPDSGGEDEGNERVMGHGSGVIISKDGWILTNSHVVHLASGRLGDAFSVELHDRRRFPAKLAGADPATDIALLKIEAPDLQPMPIGDSGRVAPGETVFAIGNPFSVGMTCTRGMVSAVRRSTLAMNGPGGYESFIQTDAAINPGNSGGALISTSGELIGINTAIYGGNGGNIGLGFAVPSVLARQVAVSLAEEGTVVRGFFGVELEDVDAKKAETLKLPAVRGTLVSSVMSGGPFAAAGLQEQDVVTGVGQTEVDTRSDARIALSFVKPGQPVEVRALRAGELRTVQVTAAAPPAAVASGAASKEFTVAALPGVFFRSGEEGLEVVRTEEAGKKSGLAKGMVLLSVNDAAVESAETLEKLLRKGVNKVVTKSGEDGQETLVVRVN